MANTLQFETSSVQYLDLGPIAAPCLVTDPEKIPQDVDSVVLDGEHVDIDPKIISMFAQTIKLCDLLQRQGNRVDCSAFAVILSGGLYEATGNRQLYNTSDKRIGFRSIVPADAHSEVARTMEPINIGVTHPYNPDGIWPNHMAVRLSEENDLYAHKLGDSSVVLGSLETAIKYYGANLAGSVLRLDYPSWLGRNILEYRAPDAGDIEPSFVYSGDCR